jgi:hypothetical protein
MIICLHWTFPLWICTNAFLCSVVRLGGVVPKKRRDFLQTGERRDSRWISKQIAHRKSGKISGGRIQRTCQRGTAGASGNEPRRLCCRLALRLRLNRSHTFPIGCSWDSCSLLCFGMGVGRASVFELIGGLHVLVRFSGQDCRCLQGFREKPPR